MEVQNMYNYTTQSTEKTRTKETKGQNVPEPGPHPLNDPSIFEIILQFLSNQILYTIVKKINSQHKWRLFQSKYIRFLV